MKFGRFYLRGLFSCACGCTDAYYKFIAVGHRNFIERESQVHSAILGARRGTNRSLLIFFLLLHVLTTLYLTYFLRPRYLCRINSVTC